MSLLTTGTGHPFFNDNDFVAAYSLDEEEERIYEASRDNFVNWMPKRKRGAWWFDIANESTLWLQDEEAEYFVSHETSLSFPRPKLGVKTRPCSGVTTPLVVISRGAIVVGRGTATVAEGETSVTISHGYTGSGVLMFATPNWNTGYHVSAQTTSTVTLGFAVPAPSGGGSVMWEAIL